jgi:tripartite-type tricarboxylate transporter receptor subunit TctC
MLVRHALAAASLGFCAHAAAAQENFYAGKQLQILVSTEPGTVYDAYARLVARVIGDHIAGRPSVIVQNMPGGGGLRVANHLANVSPRDGTAIAATHNAVLTMSLVNPDAAKFSERELSWIGSVTRDPYMAVVRADVPISTIDDAKTTVVSMGGASAGSLGVDLPVISNALFGTKLRVVGGYKDPGEVKLAMMRGEVDGTFSVSWSETKQAGLVQAGKLRIIAQHAFKPHPELGGAPLLMDQAKTDADRAALVFMLGRQEAARPYFAPPGVPRDRLEMLRTAFMKTMRDPEFLRQSESMKLGIDEPMDGASLAEFVGKLMSTPRSVTERIASIIAASR